MGAPQFLWLKHTTVGDSPFTHFCLSPQVAAPRRTWTHSPMVSLLGPSSAPFLSPPHPCNPGSWPLPGLGYVSPTFTSYCRAAARLAAGRGLGSLIPLPCPLLPQTMRLSATGA